MCLYTALDTLSCHELDRFNAFRGDPAWQAEWELLAILISLHAFHDKLMSVRAHVVVQSDSMAALGAAMKVSSSSYYMNALAAEIALVLEELGSEVVLTDHLPAALNTDADALSRLSEGASLPKSLRNVVRLAAPCRDASFYKAWAM